VGCDGWIDEKSVVPFALKSALQFFLFSLGIRANPFFFQVVTGEMKDIYKDEEFEIPDGVSVNIKSRLVTVKGPRGELTKSLRHIDMEIKKVGDKKIKLVVWHGGRKHVACLRTVRSLIMNMINGVTKVSRFRSASPLMCQGFRYKMRYVYAHFPINVNVIE